MDVRFLGKRNEFAEAAEAFVIRNRTCSRDVCRGVKWSQWTDRARRMCCAMAGRWPRFLFC